MAIQGVLTRQKCAGNGAQLYGARVSNFLSHRIVKSLTFRIYGKFKFQCTRNGPQNPPFCPGSIQDTCILFPRYLTTRFLKMILQKPINLENRTSGNMKIQKPRFTNRSPARGPLSSPPEPRQSKPVWEFFFSCHTCTRRR